MIASWMLYTLLISVLTTIAGIAAARAFEARGWPTRFVWAATLGISVAWPLAAIGGRLLPKPPPPVTVLPFTIVVEAPATVISANADRAAMIDQTLVATWLVLSLFCAFRIALAIRAVAKSRTGWKRQRVDGMRVQISDNVGPAVVGLGSMDVVLPAWILSLDASLRAIVLCHEEEHRLARDPHLLFGAAIIVALMPWNVALWYQARRLRLAVELDCDRRVLRAHPSPERYGMLMLTIAQRRSIAPTMFAPMLTEPTSNLERRIVAMRSTTKKLARVTAYGGGLVATATLLFASTLQSAPRSRIESRLSAGLTRAVASVAQPVASLTRAARTDTQTVRKLPAATTVAQKTSSSVTAMTQQGNPAPRYPDMLRSAGIEGGVIARYTTNSEGVPDSTTIEILQSSHQLFTNAVLRVLPLWHMAPNTTIETPFTFAMPSSVQYAHGNDATTFHGRAVGGVLIVSAIPSPNAAWAPSVSMTAAQRAGTQAGARGGSPVPTNAGQTYFEFQVEKQVQVVRGSPSPRYPDMLRKAEVEGQVLAQFIVDTLGHPDTTTFKVLKSDHELFTEAVRTSLPTMEFTVAEIGGKRVRQLVQMPFQFSLSKSDKP